MRDVRNIKLKNEKKNKNKLKFVKINCRKRIEFNSFHLLYNVILVGIIYNIYIYIFYYYLFICVACLNEKLFFLFRFVVASTTRQINIYML